MRPTSETHVWARGFRYELRWELRDDRLVAALATPRAVLYVVPLDPPLFGWSVCVCIDGVQRHRSEHGSVRAAQRAGARATRRALELVVIPPPPVTVGGVSRPGGVD